MLSTIKAIFTPKLRLSLYGIAIAACALLVFYHLLDPQAVPLWLALVASVLGLAGNTTAGVTLAGQLRTGAHKGEHEAP